MAGSLILAGRDTNINMKIAMKNVYYFIKKKSIFFISKVTIALEV